MPQPQSQELIFPHGKVHPHSVIRRDSTCMRHACLSSARCVQYIAAPSQIRFFLRIIDYEGNCIFRHLLPRIVVYTSFLPCMASKKKSKSFQSPLTRAPCGVGTLPTSLRQCARARTSLVFSVKAPTNRFRWRRLSAPPRLQPSGRYRPTIWTFPFYMAAALLPHSSPICPTTGNCSTQWTSMRRQT